MVAVLLSGCHCHVLAQQLSVSYDAELQTDLRGNSNLCNLLRLDVGHSFDGHWQLSAATLSIAQTRDEGLIDDLQGFSNLVADDQPLTLALAGISWTPNDRHSLFAGIRTINEDYFTSPVTSLFINSSCGIFPTLSFNMDIANYPLASMGVHYAYTAPSFQLQASAYNGQGYDRLTGAANVWRVTPRSDGLFCITQADWQRGHGHYYVGAALHTGVRREASARSALWAYTEQAVTARLSLIADYSHAFGHHSLCTDFAGFGGQYAWSRSMLGCFTEYAWFAHDAEWATELTCSHQLTPLLSLQASYQLIRHHAWLSVGLIRMSLRIS